MFPKSARNAANGFIQQWQGGNEQPSYCSNCAFPKNNYAVPRLACCEKGKQKCIFCQQSFCNDHKGLRFGKDLRDAYVHYEEALAKPGHRLRR